MQFIILARLSIFITFLHYITFPGSRVGQNDCRMWNKSYKYKNTYTVYLKLSKKYVNTQYNSFFVILKSNAHTQRFLPLHLCKVCVPTLSRQCSGPILRLLGPLRIGCSNKNIQLPHCHC
jgi:hypothetical protein